MSENEEGEFKKIIQKYQIDNQDSNYHVYVLVPLLSLNGVEKLLEAIEDAKQELWDCCVGWISGINPETGQVVEQPHYRFDPDKVQAWFVKWFGTVHTEEEKEQRK